MQRQEQTCYCQNCVEFIAETGVCKRDTVLNTKGCIGPVKKLKLALRGSREFELMSELITFIFCKDHCVENWDKGSRDWR